jgi:hypothetical protein
MSNPGNVAGGHKANLNNPSSSRAIISLYINVTNMALDTSEESKQHSRDVLENDPEAFESQTGDDHDKNPNNV